MGSGRATTSLFRMQMRHNIGTISRAFGLAGDSATKMGAKVKAASTAGASSMGRMGGAISSVRSLFAGLVISFVGFEIVNTIRQWTNEIIEFEQEFANVRTLLDDAIVPIPLLRKQVLALGGTLGKTTDLTKGLYQAISAGVEPAEAVRFVGQAAMFARGALTDTRTAVDVLTTALNAYGLEAEQAADISDVLFETIKLGKTTGEELAGSLGRVIPTAALLNVSMRQLGAVIATLTAGGLDTAEAITAVNQTLLTFIRPTEGAKLAAKGLGFELTGNTVRSLGLVGALQVLQEKMAGNTDQSALLFKNVRALRAVLPLTTTLAGKLATNMGKMGDTAGNTTEAFKEASEVFAVQFEAALTNLQKLFIGVGTEIGFVTQRLIEFNQWMETGTTATNGFTFAVRAMIIALEVLIALQVVLFLNSMRVALFATAAGLKLADFAAIGFSKSLLFMVSVINVTLATSVTELIFKLSLLKSILVFVGGIGVAAFVGWQLGTLIKDFVGLNEETKNFIQRFADFFNVQTEVVSETNALASAIVLNKILFEQYGESIDRTGKSASQFIQEVNQLGLSLQKANADALAALGTWLRTPEVLEAVTDKQRLLNESIIQIRRAVNDAVLAGMTWDAALESQRNQIVDVNKFAREQGLIISKLGKKFLPDWTKSAEAVAAAEEVLRLRTIEVTKVADKLIDKVTQLSITFEGTRDALNLLMNGEVDQAIIMEVLEKEILALERKALILNKTLTEQELKLIADTEAMVAAKDAAEELNKEIKKIVDEFEEGLNPLGEFTTKLEVMTEKGESTADMLKVYGEELLDAAEESIAAGIPISGLALRFAILAGKIRLTNEAIEDFSINPLPDAGFPPGLGPGTLPSGVEDVLAKNQKENFQDFIGDLDTIRESIEAELPLAKELRQAFEDMLPEVLEAKLQTLDDTITKLNTRYDTAAIVVESYGDEILELVEIAEKWGLTIPKNIAVIAKLTKEIKAQEEAAERFQKIWTKAMAKVTKDFARGVADIIVGFKGFKDGLIRLVKLTGRTFIETVVITWFQPFIDGFETLGQKLGEVLAGIFDEVINPFLRKVGNAIGGFFKNLFGFGGGGGAGGLANQIVGGIAGPAIGGLLGGGAAGGVASLAGAGTAFTATGLAPLPGLGATLPGAAAGGGGILGLGLTASITLGIGAAVAAGFLIWKKFISKDAFESGAKEVGRDFGVSLSKGSVEGFVQSIGLSKKAFEGIRKDITTSPRFFKEVLLPAAQASGTVDQLIERFRNLEAFGRTFDFGAAAARAANGDFTLLNAQWVDLFKNSEALAEAIPDFAEKLTVPTGDQLGDFLGGDIGTLPGLEDVVNLLNRAFGAIFENFEEFLNKLNLVVARLRSIAQLQTGDDFTVPPPAEQVGGPPFATKEDASSSGVPEFQTGGFVRKGGLAFLDDAELVLDPARVERLKQLLALFASLRSFGQVSPIGGLFTTFGKSKRQPEPAPFDFGLQAPKATGGGPIPAGEQGPRIVIKIENNPQFFIQSRSEDLERTARTEVFPLFIRMMQKNIGGATEDLIRAIEQNKQGVTARKL